ncbi:GtrA family protein [Ancylobacter dichloromethanicus]
MLVDFVAFQALFFLGAGLDGAQLSGFCLASLCNHALITRWAFPETAERPRPHRIERETLFLLVCLLSLALRGGVLAGLAGLPAQRVIMSAIGATAIATFSRLGLFRHSPGKSAGQQRRPMAPRGHRRRRLQRGAAPAVPRSGGTHAAGGLLLGLRPASRHRLSRPPADGGVADLDRHLPVRQ